MQIFDVVIKQKVRSVTSLCDKKACNCDKVILGGQDGVIIGMNESDFVVIFNDNGLIAIFEPQELEYHGEVIDVDFIRWAGTEGGR